MEGTTHKVGLQCCAEGYVVQAKQATPHDGISGLRVLGVGETTAGPHELGEQEAGHPQAQSRRSLEDRPAVRRSQLSNGFQY